MTVLEEIFRCLKKACAYNRHEQIAPAAVLWTDKERQWEPVISVLKGALPELLTFGPYQPGTKIGPAIWIKSMIARTIPEADWNESDMPIIYLPGISRMELRAIESCPKELQPLAELQYRGSFWSQKNGKDWTLYSFMKSKDGGLGLDVAHDENTLQALHRAFPQVLYSQVAQLQGRRLEEHDFNLLLTPDPIRDLLKWLDDPKGTREVLSGKEWEAFVSVCKSEFSFNPSTEGELIGAERLAHREGAWDKVWQRFSEAPQLYRNIPDLLRKTSPKDIVALADPSTWPHLNDEEENNLRKSLLELSDTTPEMARKKVVELNGSHAKRCQWVWAKLGQSPMATALEYLYLMAQGTSQSLIADTPDDLGKAYKEKGWIIDMAVLRAISSVVKMEDVHAVVSAIRSIYDPWLEKGAVTFQGLVASQGYPVNQVCKHEYKPGTCVLFVDGLRFDVGRTLGERLHEKGCDVSEESSWTPVPSVTFNAKPAVSPIANSVSGKIQDGELAMTVLENGKPLSAYNFRKLLEEDGWQILLKGDTGDPEGKAWAEFGDLDHFGHEHGLKLARYIDDQLNALVEYTECLFDAGWKQVQIITDHGWILLPGGLPKAQLPKYLTETRWGRCAILKETSSVDVQVLPWFWTGDVSIAFPDGIKSFISGREYDHGGLSLQECLTPVLTIVRKSKKPIVRIIDHQWKGLRCKIIIEGHPKGIRADIRTKPAVAESTVANNGKEFDGASSLSLVVEDDGLIGAAATLVLVDQDGSVLAKVLTTIGGE